MLAAPVAQTCSLSVSLGIVAGRDDFSERGSATRSTLQSQHCSKCPAAFVVSGCCGSQTRAPLWLRLRRSALDRRFLTCHPPLARNVLPITNRRYGRLKICATLNRYSLERLRYVSNAFQRAGSVGFPAARGRYCQARPARGRWARAIPAHPEVVGGGGARASAGQKQERGQPCPRVSRFWSNDSRTWLSALVRLRESVHWRAQVPLWWRFPPCIRRCRPRQEFVSWRHETRRNRTGGAGSART